MGLIAACLLAGGCSKSEPSSTTGGVGQISAAAATIGSIDAVEGTASLTRAGKTTVAAKGASLAVGDTLTTVDPGKLRLLFRDGTLIALGSKSKITLTAFKTTNDGRTARFDVAAGKFWAKVSAWAGGGPSFLEYRTPNAVAGVRGTTLWGDIDVDAICSLDGSIEVRSTVGASPSAVLAAGECAAQLSQGKTTPLKPTATQVEAYLDQVLIRE